jgi:hypothetical protein
MRAWHIVGPVLIAMAAHTLEIIVFAGGLYGLERTGNYGHLATSGEGLFTEFVYLSAVTYTTLGFGDITPVGPLRFLVGVESPAGLVLSAWTAIPAPREKKGLLFVKILLQKYPLPLVILEKAPGIAV